MQPGAKNKLVTCLRMTVATVMSSLPSACHDGGADEDLGKCEFGQAVTLVYGKDQTVATVGQALAHDSCGAGVACHSRAAVGPDRLGAPAELNFDMVPTPRGANLLYDVRQLVWNDFHRGALAHADGLNLALQDSEWMRDRARVEGDQLPSLTHREALLMFKNWLACGVPVVRASDVPDWLAPLDEDDRSDDEGEEPGSGDDEGPVGDESGSTGEDGSNEEDIWTTLHRDVLVESCVNRACHDGGAAGGLDLTEACAAHAALIGGQGDCDRVWVVPGDPDASFLLEKLSESPSCGVPMPVGAPLDAAEIAEVHAWIEGGAPAAATCE